MEIEQFKIEHIPISKYYRHATNPKYPKQELKFQYYKKYVELIQQYKLLNNITKHERVETFPLCLRTFKTFLAYNNIWWLVNKRTLSLKEKEFLNDLNIAII